ncbi:MAG: hypothetical protein ACI8PZ_004624 [Myxococcota bacterium]|jgi:hypothetical protein
MTRAITTVLCLLSTTAFAGVGGEISAELGQLHNGDPTYDLFSNRDGMPSRGLRVGIAPVERFTVLAGWHRVRRGADLDLPGGSLNAAFFADEFTLGPKVDLNIGDIFYPYATVQGVLFRGVMKLDDDPDRDDNAGQIRAAALSGGALFMGGLELRNPSSDMLPLQFAVHVEAGYGLISRGNYDTLGSMQPGGFVLRTGVGVRF